MKNIVVKKIVMKSIIIVIFIIVIMSDLDTHWFFLVLFLGASPVLLAGSLAVSIITLLIYIKNKNTSTLVVVSFYWFITLLLDFAAIFFNHNGSYYWEDLAPLASIYLIFSGIYLIVSKTQWN